MFVKVKLVEDSLNKDGMVLRLIFLEVDGDDEGVIVVIDMPIFGLADDVVDRCLEVFMHQLPLKFHAGLQHCPVVRLPTVRVTECGLDDLELLYLLLHYYDKRRADATQGGKQKNSILR